MRKPLSLLLSLALVIGAFVAIEVSPAAAADRIPPTTESTTTKARCRANAPVVGWVDADQTLGATVTGPKYIEQGGTFQLVLEGADTAVPSEVGGQTVVSLTNIVNKTKLAGGFTIVSAVASGPGSYKVNPSAPSGPIPGGLTVTKTATDVQMALPGPFPALSIVTAPDTIITVQATGAPGTKITSKLAGVLPNSNPTATFDAGFTLTANISGIISGSVPTVCAPNYGVFANGNGELLGTQPNYSATTITPNTNPLVDITSPLDGARYLPDAQIFADYACTETVYELSSCVATAPDGSQLDFSVFGPKTFTVTATDANGGVTAKTVTYDVGGNVTPVVSAGTDLTTNGGSTVTLLGGATDPDTGQILSYEWSQTAGAPVTLNPIDAADPFMPNQRFVAPRGGPFDLTFRLRVDDGFDTGEDSVNVRVNANNGPVFTAGAAQTINNVKTNGTVSMSGAATDPEGDTPITYAWSQVDEFGVALAPSDPLHVTLTTPAAATSGFVAPQGPGTLYLQVVATDSLGATSTGTVTVNVLANQLPVITNGASQTLNPKTGTTVQLNGTATDPDNAAPSAGHVLTYSWSQVDAAGDPLPLFDPAAVALSNPVIANPTFTAPASPTTLHFKVAVNDGYGTTTGTVTVNVIGSVAPVANAGPNQSVGRGQLVTLDGSGSSDPDGDTVTYAWTQVDGAGAPLDSGDPLHVTLSSATAQKPTFTSPTISGAPQAVHFQLKVTDVPFGLLSAADTVDITVNENSAPTANAGAAQTNKFANAVVTLTGSASSDPDSSDPLTYAWTQVDPLTDLPLDPGPTSVTLSSTTAVSPTFAAPRVPASTTLKFRLVVTDSFAIPSNPAFTTVQINANRAPAVGTPSVTPATRPIGTTVTLTVPASAADADGDPVSGFTYQWIQTANSTATTGCAPSCPVANVTLTPVPGTPRSATYVAPAMTAAGQQLFFRLSVGDGFGASVLSNNLTVSLTNSLPTVQWAVRGTNTAATAGTTNDATANRVYIGQSVELDATQNPAKTLSTSDPDGTTGFTYAWRHVTTTGGNTNCTTNCIFGGATATSSAAKPVVTIPTGTGSIFMRITVTDQAGGAATTINFTITKLANTAPTVTATGGPAFVTVGTPAVAISGTATDPETAAAFPQTLTYLWTQVDAGGVLLPGGDPLSVTINNPTTLTPTFNAPAVPGTVRFKLAVTDGAATVSATKNVDVTPGANPAPTANAGPDQSGIAAGSTLTLDGSGSSDPEGQAITYAWTQVDGAGDPIAPTVTLSSATAQKPTFSAPGTGPLTLHFKLVVTDAFGGVSLPDTVDVSVNANGTPIANAGPDQGGIVAGATVTLDGSGSSDPEGAAISYAWTEVDGAGDPIAPTVTLSSATAQKPTFAAPAAGGTLHFRLVVTDPFSVVSAPDTVAIAITTNGTPTANAGPDQSGVAANATVTLVGTGTTAPETQTITYAWTQVDGAGDPIIPTVTLSSATAQKPTFAAPTNGPSTLYFKLVVTDTLGAASPADTVDIAVNANGAPTANAGPNQTGIAPNAPVTLDGSGSTDPEAHSITYAWTQVDGSGAPITPTVTLSSATAQKPTFTSPNTPTGTTLRFSLVATDQFGAVSAPAFVLISVGNNTRPIANAGPDQTPGRGKVVTLDGSGSTDPEGTALAYQWVQTDAGGSPILPGDPLQVTLSSSNVQKPTFTAPVPSVFPKTLHFRLFVTDGPGLLSDPDNVVINLVESNAPIANAGAAQTNKATNSVVTLSSALSTDPDSDPLTRAWTQVDPSTDAPLAPGDPTAVTLSNPAAASPTFVSPHFAASTTLKFQLVVTDVPYGLASAPAFTTVQINANRAPAVGTPSVTPASRPVGTVVTVTVPASAADADGDPVSGFTYQWIQTASAAATTSCAPSCPVTNVTLTPVVGTPRSATFTVPPVVVSGASLFFRLNVTDGFGATVQSANQTVSLTNSNPVVPSTMQITAGIDGSVVNPTTIYVGDDITVSAPSTDADGSALTYAWSGRPCGGLGEALGCVFAGNNDSGYPGGSCRGITITNNPVVEGKASFTAPTLGANNPNRCGLRVVVTDAAGGSTTRDFAILNLKANTAPVAVIGAVPDKVLASTPAATSVLALSGTGSTDADQAPPQPHTYAWEQVDATTGVPVPVGSPSRGTFSTPNAATTGWTAPSTAPHTVKFRLTFDDGMSLPGVATTPPISVTTTRPEANAGSDRLVHPGQLASLDGSASFDAGGRPLTYSWAQLSGPPVTLTSPLTATASFTAPHRNLGDTPQVSVFELTTRNGLAAKFDTMTVVNSPWAQAVANAGAPQTVNTGTTGVQLDGSGSTTPAGSPLTYAWTQTGGPAVTLSSATAQKPTFTAPVVTQAGGPKTLSFSLTVNDGYSTSEVGTTTVTVNPALEAPGAPTNLVATPGNGTIRVTFTPGIDGGSPVLVYVVLCAATGGTLVGSFSGPEGVTITGATNGASYLCLAAAINAIGQGGTGGPSNAVRPSAPPSPPTGLAIAPGGSGAAKVSFTPGANGGEPNVLFQLQCTSSDGGVAGGGLFATSPATVTGLTNGKTYTCTAAALHALGSSAASAPSPSLIVGIPDTPAAPSSVVPGNAQATVTWAAPANNGAAISAYIVTPYIGATAQTPFTLSSAATSATIGGLTNGSTYTFRVQAVNARGTSAASPNSAAVVIGTPAAPPTATAAPGNGTATVSWTAPANNGSAITGYRVTPFIGAVAQAPQLFAGAGLSQTVTGLTNGTTYTFTVSAVNARGTGPSITTPSVLVGTPTAPGLVTAVAGAGQASVTWSVPANNGSAITAYIVTPVKNGVAQAPISYNATATTRVITGLTPGSSYRFLVVATNARGSGPSSGLSNAVTPT